MSDYGRSASRGAQAGTPSTPGRTRLGRQHWQDIRRARKLGAEGELHSVEIHGVKLTFRFQRSCCGAGQAKAMPRAAQVGQAAGGGTASAQSPPSTPTGSPDKQRPRRRTRVQGSTRTSKLEDARTIAGENAGRTRHAPAGETAGAGTASAQSASVCSPRRRNSRQRRSANRLVEFIRTKQAQQTAAAESPQTAAPERASPKRTHEDGVHESGGGSNSSRRRRIVDIDFEARKEAAAALYSAWRQHTLATTTNTLPKRALEHDVQEGSGKRGGGQYVRIRYVDDDD